MAGTWVELDLQDIALAVQAAAQVRANAIQAGHSDRVRCGYPVQMDQLVWVNTLGTCGELAVARFLGVPWQWARGLDYVPGRADIPSANLEVRTAQGHQRNLLVRPSDPISRPFALVTWERGTWFNLAGYLPAHHPRLAEWWSTPSGGPGVFLVPRSVLQPMEILKEFIQCLTNGGTNCSA